MLAARLSSALVLLLVLAETPLASAQSAELRTAMDLYARQEYAAAQEALLKIDPAALSEAERTELDALLKRVREARLASERAAQDMAAADKAYEAGDWDAADRLYAAVQTNEFAPAAVRQRAAEQRERIAEKKRLAEAARPQGGVQPQEQPPRAEPVSPPLPPPPAVRAEPPAEPGPPPAEGPRAMTPADELRLRNDLLWQRAVAQSEAQASAARAAINARDFAVARQHAATALQLVEAAAAYAEPVAKYEAARAAAVALQEELEREAGAYAQEQAAREREEVARRVLDTEARIRAAREEKVAQLFSVAEQLKRERRFEEAAEALREILRLDPNNARATYELTWAEDFASFSAQSQWQNDKQVQQRNALQKASDALVPWDVDVMYPRNWQEITVRRERAGLATGQSFGDLELTRQMDTTLPEVRFEETPFEQVVQFLDEMTKINLSVDWTDLVDNGIEREAPVTLQLSGVSFRTVLNEVLSQVGGDVQLAFAVGDGLLRVATKEKLDRDKVVLIYDIRDLLVRVPRASRQSAFDVTQGMGQGGGAGGGGGGMFQQGQQQQQQQDDYNRGGQGVQQNPLAEQIMEIIRQTVEPDSWRENGAGDASLRELNGQLIIYNTSDAHRQVADLLGQLRATRALQISVETRFLNVTNNFLEQFGVDLDFVFNASNAGYDQAQGPSGVLTDPATGAVILIPRDYSRIGVYPSVPGFGQPLVPGTPPNQPYGQAGFVPAQSGGATLSDMTPISAQQGSLSLATPTVGTGVPGSFGTQANLTPALNIAGSFLDNLQVDFLIRATQANSRSSIVQAPRLVLFNGQASSISVGRSRDYVSSLEPRLAEGAVGFEPVIDQADSGVSMWVEGTISADRRYVTLTLQVQQRDEPTFERFEVQRASGNSPGAYILLPDQGFITLETTVSIPDGGTVLLGGVKQAGEIEVEAGVPILSKVPVLKRAFTNQTTIKDTRTLLVLVKSKIIIQKEAEEEAFPGFTSTGA